MKKQAIMIEVLSDGKVIGTITPDAFRQAAGAPKMMFLEEAVERFNAWKEEIGEPERVRISI